MNRRDVVAVLWDADGVLQHTPIDFIGELVRMGGEDFPAAVFQAELRPLVGDGRFADSVAALVAQRGLQVPVDEVLGLWRTVRPDPRALAVVRDVRAAGIACYLATNQQDMRVELMRDALGYEDIFDEQFYSAELGVAKPDPAYFTRILEAVGITDPATAVFVDDNAANVAAAAGLGIRACRHDPATGAAGLRALLRSAGVLPG